MVKRPYSCISTREATFGTWTLLQKWSFLRGNCWTGPCRLGKDWSSDILTLIQLVNAVEAYNLSLISYSSVSLLKRSGFSPPLLLRWMLEKCLIYTWFGPQSAIKNAYHLRRLFREDSSPGLCGLYGKPVIDMCSKASWPRRKILFPLQSC